MRAFQWITALCVALSMPIIGFAAAGNDFNPYMRQRLPSAASNKSKETLRAMGARPATLQEEAAHRRHWKKELYPVVFGSPTAAGEILVLLDYAAPASERVWQEVVKASRGLNPGRNKIVVFGDSREQYGTELMGGGIWTAHARPERAMEYFVYTLGRWNSAKDSLKRQGRARPFIYEYDATASSTEMPILYSFLSEVRPAIPSDSHVDIVRYSYDAGSVNQFQAVEAARHYGVRTLPAVIVNGSVLNNPTAEAIMARATR